MPNDKRGGNSRNLAKLLDLLDLPTAILDSRGQIVFVNAALCQMANSEATRLVGQQCSWDLPSDDLDLGGMLAALAPPAAARQGRAAIRQLNAPIAYGSTATGQLFLPLVDQDRVVHLTLVVFGSWEAIREQGAGMSLGEQPIQTSYEETLVEVRNRWQKLDGLHALVGESPAIRLAMQRVQLMRDHPTNYLLYGPQYVGKSDIARGLFQAHLKSLQLTDGRGQFYPIDCEVIDGTLLAGMLEIFCARLTPELPVHVQQLVLENLDSLSEPALSQLVAWVEEYSSVCSVVGLSQESSERLAARGRSWQQLVFRIATIEVHLPPLCQRREDVPSLSQAAMANACILADRAQLTIASDTMDMLVAYAWPRNLLQLDEAIRASVRNAVLTTTIQPEHLPAEIRTYPSAAISADSENFDPVSLDDVLLDVERIMIERALQRSPRNRAQAARWLGISRPRLLRRIAQLQIGEASRPQPSTDAEPDSTGDGRRT